MTVKKVWGTEEWLHNGTYCMKRMTLRKGFQCSMHYHPIKHETFFVISGRMLLAQPESTFSEPVYSVLGPGEHCVIPTCRLHQFIGLEECTFIEASSHHDDDDVWRIDESKKLGPEEFKACQEIAKGL